MKYIHIIFLAFLFLISLSSCQAQSTNGYSELNQLFQDFPKVLMSENQDEMKVFIKKLLPDDATIAYLKKNNYSYRNIVEGAEKNPKALELFRSKYLKKMIRFQAKLKRNGQLENLVFEKMEQEEIAIIYEPLKIEATESLIYLKHGANTIKCKLGELLKIDGVWKCFTSPRF
ncbi:MAG: hypothetical protein AB8H03_04005 [Saprospiraceae bacterium]